MSSGGIRKKKKRVLFGHKTAMSKRPSFSEDIGNWGKIGHLTLEHQRILEDLKKSSEVASQIERAKFRAESTDQACLRFLRARKFDLNGTLKLLTECVKLFDENKIDEYAAMTELEAAGCDTSVYRTFYPHGQSGYDNEGRVCCYDANGRTDLDGLHSCINKDGIMGYHYWNNRSNWEELFDKAPIQPDGSRNVSTLCVLDLKGLGTQHLTKRMFNLLHMVIKVDNVCFPEMLGKVR
jgi:hypothetical protein